MIKLDEIRFSSLYLHFACFCDVACEKRDQNKKIQVDDLFPAQPNESEKTAQWHFFNWQFLA